MLKYIFFSFFFHLVFFSFLKLDFKKEILHESNTIKISYIEGKKNKLKEDNKNSKTVKKNVAKPEPKQAQKLPKKIEKKTKKKTEKKVNYNEKYFDDLLKDLTKEKLSDDKKNNQIKEIEKKIDSLADSDVDNEKFNSPKKGELRIIESILLEQIDSNWTRPPGIKASDSISIKIRVGLDIQGRVVSLNISDKTKKDLEKTLTLRPYLDSAIRAIKKSSPFVGLKKDRYNIWKEIIINFKPRETR